MNLVERVDSPSGAIAHAQASFDATYEGVKCGLAPRA